MNRWLLLVLVVFSGQLAAEVSGQGKDAWIREDLLTAQGETLSVSVKGATGKDVGALAVSLNEQLKQWQVALEQANSETQTDLRSACENWREKTANHVSCRIGALTKIWLEVENSQTALPERSDLRKQARALARIKSNELEQSANLQWDFKPLLDGFLLDSTLKHIRAEWPAIEAIELRLNDRLVHYNREKNTTDYALQLSDDLHSVAVENSPGSLVLNNRAVAINAVKKLEWKSEHRLFSRLINPVDGWPKEFSPSVVVVAPDAITAEALANALTVMNIAKGMALINRLPDTEALIMTSMGKVFASDGWYSLLIPDESHQALWERDMEFLVEYQTLPQSVAEYRRPYIAVWITDTDKNSVRQLLVHGESLRWLREIPLWWRRYGRRDETLIDGLARATPLPGLHMLVWDGRDDRGNKIEKGNYILHIEAAREHGERELVTLPFTLSGSTFKTAAKGNTELGTVSINFRKRS
jgi:thiamine biosynthesis lipoprotein